jgi:hypothetical protein
MVQAHSTAVILVEVPAAGSPKTARDMKPPAYPRQGREAWKPRTKPPSKAEATVQLVRRFAEQESSVRAYLDAVRRGVTP